MLFHGLLHIFCAHVSPALCACGSSHHLRGIFRIHSRGVNKGWLLSPVRACWYMTCGAGAVSRPGDMDVRSLIMVNPARPVPYQSPPLMVFSSTTVKGYGPAPGPLHLKVLLVCPSRSKVFGLKAHSQHVP